MDIFKKIKSLFDGTNKYGTGALESPVDPRNIALSSLQEQRVLPSGRYVTEMPPIKNQGSKPKCVGSGITKIMEKCLTKENADWIQLSDDDLYAQCKLIDGISDIPGTYPIIGAKVAVNHGVATIEAYNTKNAEIIKESRLKHKLSGYAFVAPDYEAICQAIYQNKAIGMSVDVDGNWFIGKIIKVLKSVGRHYTVGKGFDQQKGTIIGDNSWGINWIGFVAGLFDKNLKGGEFEFLWEDYKNNIYDIIAFTYIPKEILEEKKKQSYRFMKTLKLGSEGYDVKKLQEILGLPADGKFGKKTQERVIAFQKNNNLGMDGIVGINTRMFLNKTAPSLIPVLAEAIKQHEGYIAPSKNYPKGSRSWRNNNPGNFRMSSYVKKLGAVTQDTDGFAIFNTYSDGWNALIQFIEAECKPNEGLAIYKENMSIMEFFTKYAPAFENDTLLYAKTVAKAIGGSINTQMRELL